MDISLGKKDLFKKNSIRNKIVNSISIIVLVLVFVYVLIRAFTLSITYDEAYTYLYIVKEKLGFFVANNHLLNTFSVFILTTLFGDSELILRIPALIGGLFYLIGVYKISNTLFENSLTFLFSIVILVINPFVLDFFSLCRGYSLALGFMMLSISFFFKSYKNIESDKINNLLCFTFLALSVLSILTFFYIYITILAIALFLELNKILKNNRELFYKTTVIKKIKLIIVKMKKKFLIPLIPSFIIFIPVISFSLVIFIRGGYNYGTESFYSGLSTLIDATIYNHNTFNVNLQFLNFFIHFLIVLSLIIFLIIALNYAVKKLYKKKQNDINNSYLFFFGILLFIPITLMLLQTFGINIINFLLSNRANQAYFPRDRTIIFVIPIFSLFFISLFHYLSIKFKKRRLSNKIRKSKRRINSFGYITSNFYFIFFFFLLSFNCVNNINFEHTYTWKFDAQTDIVAQDLKSINSEEVHKELYLSYPLELSLRYYKSKYKLNWLEVTRTFNSSKIFDYYLLLNYQLDLVDELNLSLIKFYSISNVYLYTS